MRGIRTQHVLVFLAGAFVYSVLSEINQFHAPVGACEERAPANTTTHHGLAFHHSLGFFDDIPDQEWVENNQLPALKAQHYRSPLDKDKESETAHAWIFSNWDPYFSCPHVRKIGGLGGGPKWTCDVDRLRRVIARRRQVAAITKQQHNNNNISHCLVYSIGSNGNYQWEDGLIEELGEDCDIHVFDPGHYDRPENKLRNIHYHPWGLGSSYSAAWMAKQADNYYSFQDIRHMLGHENRTIDLFKIDCEGCEFHSY